MRLDSYVFYILSELFPPSLKQQFQLIHAHLLIAHLCLETLINSCILLSLQVQSHRTQTQMHISLTLQLFTGITLLRGIRKLYC